MAGERVKLVASERTKLGSAESRRLRRQGLVPGILYGRSEPVAIAVAERDLRAALTTRAGMHAVLDVTVDGGTAHSAILKDFQVSTVRGKLTHVDLQEVRLDQPIQAQVAVQLVGVPIGAKEGGVLSQVQREINVEALPMEIPEHIELDVSGMAIGDTLRLADLPEREGVKYLDNPDETVLATVTLPTRVEEPEPEVEEGEELPEGEVAEGGEQPEGAAEESAEAGADATGEPGTTEG